MGQLAHVMDFASVPSERRDATRRPIGTDSTLRCADGRPIDAVVADLSCDGFVVETGTPLAVGAAILIGLPGVGRREAVVVRAAAGRYGCRFTMPLAFADERTAFTDPLVAMPLAIDGTTAAVAIVEPDKLHPAVRLTILLGTSLMLWTMIIRLLF